MGGIIGGLFGAPDIPSPPPAPKLPSVTPQAARGAGEAVRDAAQRRRRLAGGGRRSTILGGGTGGATQTTTLLGG